MSDYQAFVEFRESCREPLLSALTYFLEDDGEVTRVAKQAWEQAARQWNALEGEVNPTNLIAQAAVDQCERLLPRPMGEPERRVPTEADLVRHLEWNLLNHRAGRLAHYIISREQSELSDPTRIQEALLGSLDESSPETKEAVERLIAELMKLRFGDLEDGTGGAMPCLVTSPPPFRGPGDGRTFDEALAAPRNP